MLWSGRRAAVDRDHGPGDVARGGGGEEEREALDLVRLGKAPERGVRPLRALLIRSSSDIGHLAAEYVRSASFRPRAKGAVGRVLLRLAEGDSRNEADLLSYLLFDGDFCRQLIELGQSDTRAMHDELVAFFERRIGSSFSPAG